MSTIKSSSENLTLNADGSGNDVLVQSNGSTKAIVTAESNAGLGTTSPSFENGTGLEIRYAGGNGAHLKLTDNASGAGGTNGFDLYAFNTSGYIENYEAGSLVFRNNGGERMRILAGGGLTFNGDTAAANALDDYEEGTWTPALRGSATAGNTTYTSRYGFYEKIGRTVHFRGSLHVNSQGTLDGIVYVTGLPFTSNSTTQRSTVHFGYVDSLSITASESLTGTVDGGDTEFLIRIWNSANGTSNFDDSELTDGAQFYFSGTYYV